MPDRLSVPPLQGIDCKVRRLIAQRDLPWAHFHPLSCSLYANDTGGHQSKSRQRHARPWAPNSVHACRCRVSVASVSGGSISYGGRGRWSPTACRVTHFCRQAVAVQMSAYSRRELTAGNGDSSSLEWVDLCIVVFKTTLVTTGLHGLHFRRVNERVGGHDHLHFALPTFRTLLILWGVFHCICPRARSMV